MKPLDDAELKMQAEGDFDGRAVWYRIFEAEAEFRHTKPAAGERLN